MNLEKSKSTLGMVPILVVLIFVMFFNACTTNTRTSNPSQEVPMEALSEVFDPSLYSEPFQEIWNNQFLSAKSVLQQFMEEGVTHSLLYRGLGLADFALDGNFSAFESFSKALELNPLDPINVSMAHFMAQYLPFKLDQYRDFISLLEKHSQEESLPPWIKREFIAIILDYYQNHFGSNSRIKATWERLQLEKNWVLLGPFSNVSGSGFDHDFVPISQDQTNPFLEYAPGLNNWELGSYKPTLQSQDLLMPLSSYYDDREDIAVYASKTINIRDEGIYTLAFSKEGAIEAWVDGTKILAVDNYRRSVNGLYVNIFLEAGTHNLMVKSANRQNLAAFSLSVLPEITEGNTPTEMYLKIFGEQDFFDPLINSVCAKIETEGVSIEGLFWLAHLLMEKGWLEESKGILDQLMDLSPESWTIQWLDATLTSNLGDYSHFEQKMLSLTESSTLFAPAINYSLSNYLANFRRGKVFELLEELKEAGLNWYRSAEVEMIFDLIDNGVEDLKTKLREFEDEYSRIGGVYQDLLIYLNDLDTEQTRFLLSRLRDSGFYRTSLLYKIEFEASRMGESSILAALDSYLDRYPINASVWEMYLEQLFQSSEEDYTGFQDFQQTLSDLRDTFPVNFEFMIYDKIHSKGLFEDMSEYKNENLRLFQNSTEAIREFERKLKEAKESYEDALSDIMKYHPYDLEFRDEWRENRSLPRFGDRIRFQDSYQVIDEFLNSEDSLYQGDAILVFDERKEIYFGDGAAISTQHTILKILNTKGVEDNRYQYLEFHPTFGNGRLLEAFILKGDGRKIFSDRSGQKLAFPGLEPGDYIVVKYFVESYLPGEINDQFWTSSILLTDYPVHHKSFEVVYPESIQLQIQYNNIFEEEVLVTEEEYLPGYQSCLFTVSEKPGIDIDFPSPSWRDIFPWVDISTLDSWAPIVDWYTNLYLGQCATTYSIKQKAMEICQGLTQEIQIIQALFNYVSNKIEYEDLSFLYSNYVPQTADSVLNDGYGDCKDQSALLISLLAAMGIESHIVLNTPSYTGETPYLPSNRFTHAIVLVPRAEEDIILDPTTTYSTFGSVPASMVNSYILPIHEQGEFTRLTAEVENQKTYFLMELEDIQESPTLEGTFIYQGRSANYIRSYFSGSTQGEKEQYFSELINSWIPGLMVTQLEMKNFEDVLFNPMINFSSRLPNLLIEGPGDLYRLPTFWFDMLDTDVRSWVGLTSASNGIRISDSVLSSPVAQTFVIPKPENLNFVHVPDSQRFSFESSYIEYEYQLKDDYLLITREIFIPYQIVQPEALEGFKDFVYQALAKEEEGIYLQ